jgi:hypothetical protein
LLSLSPPLAALPLASTQAQTTPVALAQVAQLVPLAQELGLGLE